MDKKINLSQLADLMSQAGGMSKAASEQFVKNFFDIISQKVLTDGLVKVKGLGTFKLIQMEDRESVNVNTGERFTIEGHQKISFTPDVELKERVNKPFAAFETVEISAEQADKLAQMEKEPVAAESIVQDESQTVTAEPEKESANDAKPVVKEVTQRRGVRFLLKFIVWILSILLVLVIALYLFWPLIGNRVLERVERNIQIRDKQELVVPQGSPVNVQPADEQPVKEQPVKEIESAEVEQETAEPEIPEPVVTEPAVTEPVVTQPVIKPQTETGETKPAVTLDVRLNSKDAAKDLTEFTEADTVNFAMTGELTVHTLKKGETITRLALRYYGTKKLWPYIVKYNNIKDAGKLQEGARIRIPVLKAK